MKRFLLVISLFSLLFTSACSMNNKQINPSQKNTTSIKKNTTAKVKIFLIAIDDNGKSGKRIDSGDSVIPVERTISTPEAPLKGALNDMFSIKDRLYGQSGLYNSLYQSDLRIDSANIVNETATVKISGTLMLGGVMDIPRVKAQISETILQFSTVKEARIYINGKTIDDALSLK